MSKPYGFAFSDDPRTTTGLAPTFIIFINITSGATYAPPGVTEIFGTGGYYFTYGPTTAIYFQLDGGNSLADSARYIKGILDPISVVDERVGDTSASIGSTSVDPTTVMGYVKRNLEFLEGDQTFDKSSGAWVISSRGSSTALVGKTIANTSTSTSRS